MSILGCFCGVSIWNVDYNGCVCGIYRRKKANRITTDWKKSVISTYLISTPVWHQIFKICINFWQNISKIIFYLSKQKPLKRWILKAFAILYKSNGKSFRYSIHYRSAFLCKNFKFFVDNLTTIEYNVNIKVIQGAYL